MNKTLENFNKTRNKYSSMLKPCTYLNWFFFLGYIILEFLRMSTFSVSNMDLIKGLFLTFTFITGLIRVLLGFDLGKNTLAAIGTAILFYVIYFFTHTDLFIVFGFFALATYGFNYEDILKRHTVIIAIGMIAAVTASFIGAIPNLVYLDKGKFVRDSFGICYPTDCASFIFFLIILSWIAWKKLPQLYFAIFGVLLFLISMKLTLSDTCMICSALFIVILIGYNIIGSRYDKWSILKKLKKPFDFLLTISFPAFTVVMFILVFLYAGETGIGIKLNELLTSRLGLSWSALTKHGISLFGTVLLQVGNGSTTFLPNSGYDFVDSSYFLILIRYGIVFYLVACILWVRVVRKAIKNSDYRLVLGMVLIAFHSLAEHHFTEINYNILLFIPYAYFGSKAVIEENNGDAVVSDKENKKNIGGKDLCENRAVRNRFYLKISAVIIIFTAVILLTSVFWLNDLRTIADYLKDNTKLDMTIVFLSFFAVVCGIFFFMLKSCFKLVQKGDGRKQNVIVLSICSGLILAMVIISKVYISHIGEATEAERLGDKYALGLIEESRTGDVYSVKYPSLYKSDYPSMTRSIMYSEDLARKSNATVLVDKDDELYVFTRRGFLYAQISQNSAVYTNDDAVIKSLSEHGYTPKGYYPRTKTQGVGDKATGNDLRACEYDAVIKLDVGGNIPETGTVGGIIVEGEKNNVLIEKKEILTGDIDKSGESVVTIHFTLPSDTPNVRVKVNGFGGSEITVNSITIVPAPKYDIHKKFDKNMNLIEEKFYSIDGEPVLNDNGYSICRYEYDDHGKLVSTKYYDTYENEITD